MQWLRSKTHSAFLRVTKFALAFIFVVTVMVPPSVYAQTPLNLPAPGTMVPLSPAFSPSVIIGLRIHPENPLALDFIIDKGDSGLEGRALSDEAERLVRYFFAALTIPEDEVWVNLSPYEKDRIVPDSLGQTDMGRDMLAQDYLLKQITASLIYPEQSLGKTFWDKTYKKAFELYGTTNIGIDTFNKVWIMPKKNVIYEDGDKAFIIEASLKVMLEEDYLALDKNRESAVLDERREIPDAQRNAVASSVVREVIIPELEKEVNTGKNFDQVRQIYHSVVLASWFKNNLKNAALNKVYSNQNKIDGITIDDSAAAQKIYAQYLEAFKKGVCNYIKVEQDPYINKAIPRKYFSGGLLFGNEIKASSSILAGVQGQAAFTQKAGPALAKGQIVIAQTRTNHIKVKQRKMILDARDEWKKEFPNRFNNTEYIFDRKAQANIDEFPGFLRKAISTVNTLFSDAEYPYTLVGSVAYNVYALTKRRPADMDIIFGVKDLPAVFAKAQQYQESGMIKGLSTKELLGWDGKPNGCIRVFFEVQGSQGKWIPVEAFAQNHLYFDNEGKSLTTGSPNGLVNLGLTANGINLVQIGDQVIPIGDREVISKLYLEGLSNELMLLSFESIGEEGSFTPKAMERYYKLRGLGLSDEEILMGLKESTYRPVIAEFSTMYFESVKRKFEKRKIKESSVGLVRSLLRSKKGDYKDIERGEYAEEEAIGVLTKEISRDREKLKEWWKAIKDPNITKEQIKAFSPEFFAMRNKYLGYARLVNASYAADFGASLGVFVILEQFITPLEKEIEIKRFELLFDGEGPISSQEVGRVLDEQVSGEEFAEQENLVPVEAGGPEAVGGIDFNADSLNTEIKGEGIGLEVQQNLLNMDPDSFDGLIPVIMNIVPATGMTQILGQSNEEIRPNQGLISKEEKATKIPGRRHRRAVYA